MGTPRLRDLANRFRQEAEIYKRVLGDDRTPRPARWLLGAAVAYALSPIDLIPDFIPVLGHLDDVIALPLLVWLAVRMIPREILAEHRASVARSTRGPAATSAATTRGPDSTAPHSA